MKLFEYELYNERVILTSLTQSQTEIYEFRFPFTENGTLLIGKMPIKIERGVGRVKIHELEEGIFTPHLISGENCYQLEKVRIFCGILTPLFDESAFVCRGKLLLGYERRLDEFDTRLRKIESAVYGKKIF